MKNSKHLCLTVMLILFGNFMLCNTVHAQDYVAGESIVQFTSDASGYDDETGYGRVDAYQPPSQSVNFAVIGDYGDDDSEELDVRNLIESWNVDYIVTVGDNNYGALSQSGYQHAVGNYYGAWLPNDFYPSIGNHDCCPLDAYFAYFQLPQGPGNEEYYQFTRGPVEFFILNSDDFDNAQATWVQATLQASTATYQIVVFHHAAYSSGLQHGSQEFMQLDYANWGADVVLTGHDHHYERIFQDGIVYFVNGVGGKSLYGIGDPVAGSQVRYNDDFGAMWVTGDSSNLTFEFYARTGSLIDSYTISGGGGTQVSITVVPDPGDPVIVPPQGQFFVFNYDVTVDNNSTSTLNAQIWNTITLPMGEEIGPIQFTPLNISVSAGGSYNQIFTFEFPPAPAPATYIFNMNLGTFPNIQLARDTFAMIRTSGPGLAKTRTGGAENWVLNPETDATVPDEFVLEQNYPNPFNPSTAIRYGLKEETHVKLKIYNTLGQEVATLVDEVQNAGFKSVTWNGTNSSGQPVSTGVYLYKIKAGDQVKISKMIFAK